MADREVWGQSLLVVDDRCSGNRCVGVGNSTKSRIAVNGGLFIVVNEVSSVNINPSQYISRKEREFHK